MLKTRCKSTVLIRTQNTKTLQIKAVAHKHRLFSWIHYREPKALGQGESIRRLVGIDTEAFTSGKPFMFCTSLGDVWTPTIWPRCLFQRRYRDTDLGVWNLKYDSGAFLYHLPVAKLKALRKNGRVKHNGVRYRYIPHKMLRLTWNHHTVTIWDVMPFFGGGLHYNCEKYLGWKIQDVDDKRHTPDSIKKNWLAISRGCLQSAKATSELASVLLDQLATLGLHPTALYSMASIAQRYFREECPTIDVWRFWKTGKRVLLLAIESFSGGKFEVLRRGSFKGYLYDIIAAYASVIRDLIDIRDCDVVSDSHYHKKATYGFLRVSLWVDGDIPHPVSMVLGGMKVYPQGRFRATVTKREYEYLKKVKAQVKIDEAVWLYCKTKETPYRKAIDRMTMLKSKYKDSNPVLSKMAKGINNSFYGKMIQLTPEGDKFVRAGTLWNPIYAAIITSEIRLKVCEAQQLLGKSCLALHADSIITTKKLPKHLVGSQDGQWELKRSGSGVVIGNGIYQIADKVAFRGFDLRDGTRWTDLLAKMGKASTFSIPSKRAVSWVQAIAQDRPEDINRFIEDTRKIDLNADCKRIWLRKATGISLLKGLQDSMPVLMV